jgi:BlaI family transcriptional regulator, penicillinase repressor
MAKRVRPSELELQILAILWDRGPSPIRAIREALPDGKTRAYTTVLTLVQIMEKKGLVGHESQGQTHVYHPLVQRRQVLRPMMRDLLRNVFLGNPTQAVQCLLDGAALDEDELAQIQELVQNASRRPPKDG